VRFGEEINRSIGFMIYAYCYVLVLFYISIILISFHVVCEQYCGFKGTPLLLRVWFVLGL
jgi:hypothetical protein